LLVVDGTRASTLATARALQSRVEETVGAIPFLLILNKSDLEAGWEIGLGLRDPLARAAQRVVRTSAKTGAGVEQAFAGLVDSFLDESRDRAR
jgi:50S ribosomal subunit-associated GTPase HflX